MHLYLHLILVDHHHIMQDLLHHDGVLQAGDPVLHALLYLLPDKDSCVHCSLELDKLVSSSQAVKSFIDVKIWLVISWGSLIDIIVIQQL